MLVLYSARRRSSLNCWWRRLSLLFAPHSGVAWADNIGAIDGSGSYVAAAVVPFAGFAAAYIFKIATLGL